MLEDELRELFAAAVRTPPVAAGPADKAIRKGRRAARRRHTVMAMMAVTVFAAALGGVAGTRSVEPTADDDGRVSYQNLFGVALDGVEQPVTAAQEETPTMRMPVDVRVGDQLFTADGARVTLVTVGRIDRVLRVPAGWVYSDDRQVVRLATPSGEAAQLASGITSWQVDAAGSRLASTSPGSLTVRQVPAQRQGEDLVLGAPVTTLVPAEARLVAFAGEQAVVRRSDRVAFDLWNVTGIAAYTEIWNNQLQAVFSNGSRLIVGLVRESNGKTCLVEVAVEVGGLRPGAQLGCDTMFTVADGRITVSPDGQWLAVGTPTGVHLVDLAKLRQRGTEQVDSVPGQVSSTAFCAAAPTSPTIWADRTTVLVVTDRSGVVACRADGTRYVVPLPAGVTSNWELIPAVADLTK